jgi:hypothetical protein
MKPEEFNEQATKVLDMGWGKIRASSTNKYAVSRLYWHVHGDNPCCLDVLEDFYTKELPTLINYKPLNQITMSKSNFQIKPNQVIYLKSRNMHVTNANVTDELAMEIMIQYGATADKFFASAPSDKSTLLDAYKANKGVRAAKAKEALTKQAEGSETAGSSEPTGSTEATSTGAGEEGSEGSEATGKKKSKKK